MKEEDLISVSEFCRHYAVDLTFVRALQQAELIEVIAISDEMYIRNDQLAQLERMARFHYDLDINLEGIEVISRLLQRIDDMQREMLMLKNRLRGYEKQSR